MRAVPGAVQRMTTAARTRIPEGNNLVADVMPGHAHLPCACHCHGCRRLTGLAAYTGLLTPDADRFSVTQISICVPVSCGVALSGEIMGGMRARYRLLAAVIAAATAGAVVPALGAGPADDHFG